MRFQTSYKKCVLILLNSIKSIEITFVPDEGLLIPFVYNLIGLERKKQTCSFWWFNNKFGNILQKVKLYFPDFFSNGHLLAAGTCTLPRIVQKIAIFSIQIGGWAFVRAWTFNRDFMVHQTGMQNVMVTKMKCTTGKKLGIKMFSCSISGIITLGDMNNYTTHDGTR